MITDKYFTTNINIHYMIKKLECDYILRSGIPTLFFFFTYNKASISLTLEDTSRYLQGRYIEFQPLPFPNWNLQKKFLFNSKDKDHELCNSVQSVMRHPWYTNVCEGQGDTGWKEAQVSRAS